MSPRDFDSSGKLTRFSLDRRITVLVLFLTMAVVGGVATVGIPLELMPAGFEAPFLGVNVPYRETPAPEVQEKITIPLEDELSTIKGLAGINSLSWTGGSRVWLRFKQGTDMDVAYRETRDRVERARALFPDDVERIYYRKHDASALPVAMVGVALDPDLKDSYNLIQKEVVLPLQRIDGVASVDVRGLEEKEILIEVDRSKVEGAGLNIYSLAMELSSDNFTLASGDVQHGERKLLLRSLARYDDVEALENRMVGPNTRLRDIATITYDEPEKQYRVRVNSRPAYGVMIFKEGQANTMQVSERIAETVEKIQENPRVGTTELGIMFSQGNIIRESLDTLLDSGKIGGIMAMGVLFLFLRRFRMTAIIALSIPVSILIALTAMYFAGESLNIVTLLALMISVGLLVDNSVVVAENIFRLHREGTPRREACLRGAGEIALAIVMATLTTVAVFLPVSLVDGQAQFFLLRLALPISVSLTASLLVALVFIPLTVYVTLGRSAPGGPARRGLGRRLHGHVIRGLRAVYELTFGVLNRAYLRFVAFFLVRRLDLVLLLIVIFAVTAGVAFQEVSLVGSQEDERNGFEIDIEMPPATTLEEAEEWFAEVEKIMEERKQELDLQGYIVIHTARWGEVEGWFNNPRKTKLTPREATRQVQDALPLRPGMVVFTGEDSEVEQASGQAIYAFSLQGDDYETLEDVAEALESHLVTVPGVLGVKGAADQAPQELALVLDRDRAQRQQVNPSVVAGLVGYALRGQALPRYREDGRDIPVRVRFREEDRKDLDELASFLVPTEAGASVPLSSITESAKVPTYRGIFRQNKRISRNITLELEEGKEKETREALSFIVANMDLPEGVLVGADIQRVTERDEQMAMLFAALFSILFIYLLMGYLFESFILPLSIILTIPLAAIGVGWVHFAFGRDIDFLGLVGAVLLIGVVVNNGIVLIDYVNRLRSKGIARREAILAAADRRFRPIMMTALTTIFGMIPLIMGGRSSIGISYTSFGLTLIGGMTTATLMTLLVVPVFYTMFDDGREWVSWALRRTLGHGRGRKQPAPALGPAGTRAP